MRKMIILLVFLLILGYCFPVFASSENNISFDQALITGGKESKIDFQLVRHFIVVKAKISGLDKSYSFILDTGMNVNFVNNEMLKEINVKKLNDVSVNDTTGKNGIITNYLLDSIRIGDCQVNNTVVAGTDLSSLSKVSGQKIDGIVGDNFLRLFRVSIDYQNRQVIFSKSPEESFAKYIIKAVPHPPFTPIAIPISVDGNTRQGIVDTGSANVLLPLDILEKLDYPGEEKIAARGSMSGGLLGRSDKDLLVRVKNIKIVDMELQDYPVYSVKSENTLLGYRFLSQFLITLDYPNNLVLLTPYPNARVENNVFSTGLALDKNEKGEILVIGVWEGSPAAKNDIQVGDIITEINSRKAREISQAELMDLLLTESVKTLDLTISSQKNQRKVSLKKQFLFKVK